MRSVRLRAPLLALSLCAATVAGPRASQEGSPPDAAAAAVAVVVTDAQGRAILGLEPADFELRDDGVAQTIEGVEFTTPAGARLIGILLDEFHVSPANTTLVRDALRRFVDEALRPDDLVVIVKPLDSLSDIPLTQNRAALQEQIDTFEGRKGDYQPKTPFEETYMSRAPGPADAQRAQVVVSALGALARQIGERREGRKAILLVSEGFTDSRRDRIRGPGVQAIVRSANHLDVAIYTATPGIDDSTMLRTLAEQTGGTSIGAAELDEGLRRSARDLDGYYRVAYRPSHASDGRRHALDVQVTRPGAQVRAPREHWTPPPEPARLASAGSTASLRRRPQQTSPLIRPWFGMSRGSDGKTRVTFTWEANRRSRTEAETLTLSAVGAGGEVLFDGRVDPIRTIGASGEPGLSAVFEAPPGIVQLDMTIRGADGRTLGSDIRDLDLPDLHEPRTILSTPEIFRTRTALEFRAVSADTGAPPVSSRAFSRTERLLIRVRAYGAAGDPPAVSARLVSRRNQPLRDLTALPEAPANDLTQFDLPLSSLAVGQYALEIRADDLRELILFEVGN